MFEISLGVVALLVVFVTHWIYRWYNPKCKGKLPPGAMGFPLVGETLELFTSQSSFDIPPFIKKRMDKYGPIYRTSLVGKKVIVSADPDVNWSIFQQEGKNFIIWYTESFLKIIGKKSMITYHGMFHKYIKNLVRHLVSPENLREKLLPEMDQQTRRHMESWAAQGTVDLYDATPQMIFELIAKKVISYDESKSGRKLRDNFKDFIGGLLSFPLYFPGTAFYKCLQARKHAIKVIKESFDERRKSKKVYGDFLDHLLQEIEKEESFVNEELIINLVFMLLFASHETTSIAFTLAVKFIAENPKVLEELTKEHEAILKNRDGEVSGITWQEYQSMTFTQMVINETNRLANLGPGLFRKVVKDTEMKGYTFPEGWVVMVVPTVIHLDPNLYEDPLTFNPWRWEGIDLHSGSKIFQAFGGGVRLCVGAHFAKLQMALLIHYLVTKYRWKIIKGGEIVRKPNMVFPNGLHIEISEKNK